MVDNVPDVSGSVDDYPLTTILHQMTQLFRTPPDLSYSTLVQKPI